MKDALKMAKYYKKKNKSKSRIIKTEEGGFFPRIVYRLYLDKVISLGST